MDNDVTDTPLAPAATVAAAKATPSAPSLALTVKFAFADYQQGQRITDATEVAAVLSGENAANVLKTAA
ncbi:hypothetical protein QN366_04840 [Pseudomonas sp. CCC3.2]|uniref:hypothetical protein n=1 Tax=unclassified Pseudomonas TaxID=196821 RepID=UPI002AB4A8A2|nr:MULTISPECIES: hypothetical protein [unclassified Pseudomonas]MDY7559960.1 hypothetical protein [Pseudomonas sp. AB6]MEA9994540.1 hypothetical protein [Pseudomonas sp. AA4]MEB0085685.1 hypothetical protein [Pseudomonas sp. RTI1]MEB0125990.1 hypothetical protein [Pseudomonas sp. CCC1.2]MEB0152794.1 hypothetical protein [Pseudomonas sp. CCC4.3]